MYDKYRTVKQVEYFSVNGAAVKKQMICAIMCQIWLSNKFFSMINTLPANEMSFLSNERLQYQMIAYLIETLSDSIESLIFVGQCLFRLRCNLATPLLHQMKIRQTWLTSRATQKQRIFPKRDG